MLNFHHPRVNKTGLGLRETSLNDPRSPEGDSKLVRRTTVDLVLEALRQRILSGQLRPAPAAPGKHRQQELGVSRIPVRDGDLGGQAGSRAPWCPMHAHRQLRPGPIIVAADVVQLELRLQIRPALAVSGEAIHAGTGAPLLDARDGAGSLPRMPMRPTGAASTGGCTKPCTARAPRASWP